MKPSLIVSIQFPKAFTVSFIPQDAQDTYAISWSSLIKHRHYAVKSLLAPKLLNCGSPPIILANLMYF